MLTIDNCFDAQDFCTFWDAAYGMICEDDYIERIMGCADHGWALDALLDRFLEGMTPTAAVIEIIDGYDPTP
jgi:hypothetical protein